MGKRKLPFGYTLENGDIKRKLSEAECVNKIYTAYGMGASLRDIAAELNQQSHPSYDEDRPWDKSMVNRILHDRRYSGDALYPQIIPETLYDTIQRQRAGRRGVPRQTEAQKVLHSLGVGRLSETIEANILTVLNQLILHPDIVQCPVTEPKNQADRMRIQREFETVLACHPIDEGRAARLIKAQAEAEYTLIGDEEYETERLRRIFRKAEPLEVLSAGLLRKTVSSIRVESRPGKLILKNKQMIEMSE